MIEDAMDSVRAEFLGELASGLKNNGDVSHLSPTEIRHFLPTPGFDHGGEPELPMVACVLPFRGSQTPSLQRSFFLLL